MVLCYQKCFHIRIGISYIKDLGNVKTCNTDTPQLFRIIIFSSQKKKVAIFIGIVMYIIGVYVDLCIILLL